MRLFEQFVGKDDDKAWLTRLASLDDESSVECIGPLFRDGMDERLQSPFTRLPPIAQLIGWLIVSHHRMPTQKGDAPLQEVALQHLPGSIEKDWCGYRGDATAKEIKTCWNFQHGTPFKSRHWRQHVRRIAKSLLLRQGVLNRDWLEDPYVIHVARLALMLADHSYSSEPSHARYGDAEYSLNANTDRSSGQIKQRLDEHLIGVEVTANRIARALPRVASQLPRIARHRGFRQRSKTTQFRWQDRAFDLAETLGSRSINNGFFGVNMASTGYGKTLANGRILYAISDPHAGARFTIALGLRTLTLQTGDAYREKLGLGPEDMAILVGGNSRILYEHQYDEDNLLTPIGSESSIDLLPESNHVHFEGSLEDGPLKRWLDSNRDAQKLLQAPILVCTIDHLISATEGTRGGYQIAPTLRLISSDLILDEPDDFGIEDLPALTRLVNLAGLMGSRVILSSATLPPSLVHGLFKAYSEGRRHFHRNRGIPDEPLNICCAWFDEFSAEAADHSNSQEYLKSHQCFVEKRLLKLAKTEVRRRSQIQPLPISLKQDRKVICNELAGHLVTAIHSLHSVHHSVDPRSEKRVSFGLIRMANMQLLNKSG